MASRALREARRQCREKGGGPAIYPTQIGDPQAEQREMTCQGSKPENWWRAAQ
ncbi:hypothetical protein GGTG_06885 [Gaeumannomyces tritici R3-111a-1]|uniref:Uncharacterized protein n=1 Tax=Gaeumannomyces tritici (strain R3-111a-1) TaxID=644352 RepID=J3P038_GAET3|nr:hypothetical protein GGTG_06885 [Gaeumannomyces tritici R3-111a-1]EJT76971.1 hypothetical protein GGTG_06885 [Gaeumannomyces tritici R3-111a-1]